MSRKNFILTMLGILLAEQWFLVILDGQSRTSWLAIFILVTAFLDQHFVEKLGWAVLLLLIAEFKTGGQWGLLPLALLLTLLAIDGVGKNLVWPVRSFLFSALWIFFWSLFFMGVHLGLELLFTPGVLTENAGEQWRIGVFLWGGRVWWESAMVILGFMGYYRWIKTNKAYP